MRDRRLEATAQVLLTRACTAADPAERSRLLDEVIELYMPVARTIAGRYRGRGVAFEDLEQVAFEGLTKAAHRFDPRATEDGHGSLLAFAVPTIRGEIRRYFRDHGWMVRPLRRVQDLQARLQHTTTTFATQRGRWPSPRELADLLDVPLEHVNEALTAHGCFTPASLDQPHDETTTVSLSEWLPCERAGADFVDVEVRVSCAPVLHELDERSRRILVLHYLEGLSQRRIGEREGLSQMQVSRILRSAAQRLRAAWEAAA